jgi:hypothetical protein
MKTDRDKRLGAALRRLDVPAHHDGFFDGVWTEIAAGLAQGGAARPRERRRWFPWSTRAGGRRLHLAWAGALIAAIAAAALFGLPGGRQVADHVTSQVPGQLPGGTMARGLGRHFFGGPEPASAAEVARIAQRALRAARTITADFGYWDGDPGSKPRFGLDEYHVILAADGSYRVTEIASARKLQYQADALIGLGGETTYDAQTGVLRGWGSGWDGEYFGKPIPDRLGVFAGETVGVAPGQPEGGDSLTVSGSPAWGGRGMQLFGAVARIVRAGAGGEAQTGMFDGRPVWVVSCPVTPEPEDPPAWAEPDFSGWVSPVNKLSVTVDQLTGLPVRVQEWVDDKLAAEARFVNVQVDATVPDDAFTLTLPTAAEVRRGGEGLYLAIAFGTTLKALALPVPNNPNVSIHIGPVKVSTEDTSDEGFRYLSIDQVEAAIGRPALVPARVPGGFKLARIAIRQGEKLTPDEAKSASKDDRALAGTGVVSLRFESGFEAIAVTTRMLDPSVYSERFSINRDPFIGRGWTGAVDCRTPIELTSGAFAGARGMVVIAPLTIPHLWAVKDGFLLTVGGDASAKQLLAVANSMETYAPSSGLAPSASSTPSARSTPSTSPHD